MGIAPILLRNHYVAPSIYSPGLIFTGATSAVTAGVAETAGGGPERPNKPGERSQLRFDPDDSSAPEQPGSARYQWK